MKSQVRIVLALLLVFSAGLVQPCLAVDHVEFQCPELDLTVRVSGNTTTSDEGPGETGEILGDPDGWLGGQNFRPTPPISSDIPSVSTSSPARGRWSMGWHRWSATTTPTQRQSIAFDDILNLALLVHVVWRTDETNSVATAAGGG